ncbi:MAG: TIGR04283 family arsenosugar biosynthesis glycosyltransferase [Janthinobacterium lividum]
MIPWLSVVIPTLDAAATLPATLRALAGAPAEVVVADGGSRDATADLARSLGARVLSAPRGRGPQLAAGIAACSGPWLLLLHADTRLQPGWQPAVRAHLAAEPARAAHFRLALDSPDPRARRLERLVAWRCRVLRLPYGDQGLLLPRALLDAAGGMPCLPLMEDVALVRALRRLDPRGPAALDADALTSAARWERDGWLCRSSRNLLCLALWRAGLPPAMIARLYAPPHAAPRRTDA